jgi:CHASE3 domain sensor protein
MPEHEWLTLLGMGAVFVLLGIGATLWGRREENGYYDALATRFDVREFLSHWPPRIEPKALKIGGSIAIILGVLLLIAGGVLFWTHRIS